jgi:hydrocephalus-inducing protein
VAELAPLVIPFTAVSGFALFELATCERGGESVRGAAARNGKKSGSGSGSAAAAATAAAELAAGSLSEVAFRETLMFQTCQYPFLLRNTGKVSFQYDWRITEDAMGYAEGEGEPYMPFAVEPAHGVVQPGDTQTVLARFSPLDSGEFAALLTCEIENADPEATLPAIELSGTSRRPFCHFELPGSDYVTAGRRDKRLKGPTGLPGQLDPSTRVFEMVSCGVGTVTKGSFFITNPVDVDYEFRWKVIPTGEQVVTTRRSAIEVGPFRCLGASSLLKSGKKIEVAFEFAPRTLELTETFWEFVIPEHGVSIPFLLVGRAVEPKITSDRNVLHLMPLLTGQTMKSTLTLRNDEAAPFHYVFRKDVLENVNRAALVKVTPAAGTIKPHGVVAVTVLFSPHIVQPYNFQLFCDVKKKPSPIVVNVRCMAYSVEAALVDESGEALQPGQLSTVDFGSVPVYDVVRRTYTLHNNGDHPFDFDWKLPRRKKVGSVLAATPVHGSIEAGGRASCQIVFAQRADVPCTLDAVPIQCCVSNGPTFPLLVSGSARLPRLGWSFTRLNFGKVFVYEAGMQPPFRTLEITNEDVEQVSLASTIAPSDVFAVDFSDTTIQPGETVRVNIAFTPTDALAYSQQLVFRINSRTSQVVTIAGVGTALRLSVDKLPQRVLNFGSLRVGQTAERKVEVVNRSAIAVEFQAIGDPEGLAECALDLAPRGLIRLKPGESTNLTFAFEPTARISRFSQKIIAECQGHLLPLMTVQGACQGVQLEMDNDQLAFGVVAVQSRAVKRVLLSNTGDVGAKFKWDIPEAAQQWFTITPAMGYLSPGLEVIMLVTFHPTASQQDIRFEGLACAIEGGGHLLLDLVATASPQKAASDTIQFSTAVRTTDTKAIKLENKSAHPYHLTPVIEHEYFRGASHVTVEPGQTKLYEVAYTPLAMNQFPRERAHKDDAHAGSVFFALPDGDTLMYSLQGLSGPPKSAGAFENSVPCKVPYVQTLPITNWLAKPQRFKMSVRMIKPSTLDSATKLGGLDYIDVPSHATRDYKLDFFAYREGTTQAEIHLKNEATGEYIFFEVLFKATPAGILDKIELNTCVRSVARQMVLVSNPLSTPVTVTMTCAYVPEPGQRASGSLQCNDIHGPASIRLPPGSKSGAPAQGKYSFDFLPLIEGRRDARLTLACPELGSFQYDLVLNATAHGPLPVERFSAYLGETITHKYKFTNYYSARGEYTVAVDNPAFIVPLTVSTVPTSKPADVEFEVTFEPSQLGSVKATMLIQSKIGGTYTCPLFGECLLPRPAGPFVVKAGSSAKVPFKNVFDAATDFIYSIDNEAFSLSKSVETVKAKDTKDIFVKYESGKEGVVRSARLMVTASNGPHIGTNWVFYLSGVPS